MKIAKRNVEISDWVALAAIIISLISFALSFLQNLKSERSHIRPMLAVVYDGETGWRLRNIGNGPALNIVVAQRRRDGEWIRPVRIPPLQAGTDFHLKWLGHDNVDEIGTAYEDFQGREYSSTCESDLTRIFEERVLPKWEEKTIGRHWWRDPTQPTAPGELK